MKKGFKILFFSAALLSASAQSNAQERQASADTSLVGIARNAGKVDIYGSVTNYMTYDSRESYTAACGLYSIAPMDVDISELGQDMNDSPKMQFLSVATRLGLNWQGFRLGECSLSSGFEADFCSQLNGAALFRLRDAYFKLDALISPVLKGNVLLGQTRHPMAADYPNVLSLNLGAPFNPYNFSPQLSLGCTLFDRLGVDLSLLWQMQYASTGPEGVTNSYMNYGTVPEVYAALRYTDDRFIFKLGGEMLSIKPRIKTVYPSTDVYVWVTDRITTFSAMAYGEYSHNKFSVKAKSILSQAGEHLGLMSGYSVKNAVNVISREYTPYQVLSSWIDVSYGNRLIFDLFGGYIKNFGTVETTNYTYYGTYFANDVWNMNRMWRVVPSLNYTFFKGHLCAGLQYELTSVQYGDKDSEMKYNYGLADRNLRWVNNHRIEFVVSCRFGSNGR